MNRKLKIFLSVPRTIWFNFRYLPFREAMKLPVWIANNVRIRNMSRGSMILETIKPGIVRIGYHEADGLDIYGIHTIIDISQHGILKIKEDAHIGQGAVICIRKEGIMSLGKNFAVSGSTKFICKNKINIGNDVQFSWDSTVMDTNAHKILYDEIHPLNQSIEIGNKVWIASNVAIFGGAVIGDNSVLGAFSLINKRIDSKNVLIAGIPAKVIKPIRGWEL